MPAVTPRKSRSQARRAPHPQRAALAAKTAELMESTISFIECADYEIVPREELLAEPSTSMGDLNERTHAPADTPPYLASLYEFPLLDRQQEYQIFRKMHFLRYEAAQLQARLTLSRLNARRVARIQALLAEADAVRNRIVQCNLRLVVSIAKTLVDGANSLDDLISEGNFPLIRAAEIFDFTRGLRFSTYATWAIRNGLFRVTTRNRRTQSRFRTDEPDWLLQSAADASGPEEPGVDRERMQQLVNQLDDRSRTIVRDRFGLTGKRHPAKFRELASKLRLSSERVRQLLAKALDHLRSQDLGTTSR